MDALSKFLRDAQSLETRLRVWLEREDSDATELIEFNSLLKEQHAQAQMLNSFHDLPVLLRKIHNVERIRGIGSGNLEREMILGLYYGICDREDAIQEPYNSPVVINSRISEVTMAGSLADDALSEKGSCCQSRCSSLLSDVSIAGESTDGAVGPLKGSSGTNKLTNQCHTEDKLQRDRIQEVENHPVGLKKKKEGLHKTQKRKRGAPKQPEISDSDKDERAKSHWSHTGKYAISTINPEKCDQCAKAGHLCRVWDRSKVVRRRTCQRCTRKRISCGRARREAHQEIGTQALGVGYLEYDGPSSPESAVIDQGDQDLHQMSTITSERKKSTALPLEHEAGSQDSPLDLADTSICTVTGYDCTTENTFDQIKNHTKSIDGAVPIETSMLFEYTRSITPQFLEATGEVRNPVDTKDAVSSPDICRPSLDPAGLPELVSSHRMLTNQVVQLSATLEEVLTQVPTFAGRLADIEISNVEIFRHLFAMQNFIESGIISNDRLSVKLENIFPDNLFGDASIMDRFDGIKQANDEFALKLSTMHSSIDRAIQHTDELGVKLETSINADKPKNAAILSLLTKIEQSNEILISQMSSIHSQATRDDDWGLAIKNIIGNLVPPDPSRHPTLWAQLSEVRSNIVESAADISLSMSNLESKLATIEELTTALLSRPLLLDSHVVGGECCTECGSRGHAGYSNDIAVSNQSHAGMNNTRSHHFGFHDWRDPSGTSRERSKIGLSDENDTSWIPLHEFRTDAVNTVPRAEFLDGNSVSSLPGRNYMLRE